MWIGTDCQQDEVFNENTYTWPTGQKYTGEFIKNPNTSKNNSPMIPHGKGTCKYPDGRKFDGTFNLGVPAEGKWNVLTDIKQDNKMYTSDGRVYEVYILLSCFISVSTLDRKSTRLNSSH